MHSRVIVTKSLMQYDLQGQLEWKFTGCVTDYTFKLLYTTISETLTVIQVSAASNIIFS